MINQLEDEFISMIQKNKEDFYKLTYSYVKNEQDALDILGECTYKALNSLPKLKEKKYMKTWFYRILINESITVLRKKKTLVYDSQFIETITVDVIDKDEIIDLYKAFDKLSDKYKTVIILKYMKDMQINEIAEILQININTVKTRLKRGIEKLRTILEVSING